MTIGSDARAAASTRLAHDNSGFAAQSLVNLGLQATESAQLAAYLDSIKSSIQTAIVNTGYYSGGFKLKSALKNTESLPPKHARHTIDEVGHPYNAVWASFIAWAKSEELTEPFLFKETLYLLPPPNENYDFSLTFNPYPPTP